MTDPFERRTSTTRVSEWLGLTPRSVRNLIHRGDLDAVDLHAGQRNAQGKPMLPRWAISINSVRRFLAARTSEQKTGNADVASGAEVQDSGP